MKFCLLFAFVLAIALPATLASKPTPTLVTEKMLHAVSARTSQLLRRLRARQEHLSVDDGSVALSASLATTARMRLLEARKNCSTGNKKACARAPMLLRRAAVLHRSARKAVAAEEKRKDQLAEVESAIKLAVRYNYHPSTEPRPHY